MTGGTGAGTGNADAFGSAAEEAARLVDALGQWLAARSASRPGVPIDLDDLNAHLATGSAECLLCPLCRLISLARQSSPELAQRLDEAMEAVAALVRAAVDGLERHRAGKPTGSGFETIDIT